MTTEIRFFALKSKKEKVLDRSQNVFCNVKTATGAWRLMEAFSIAVGLSPTLYC